MKVTSAQFIKSAMAPKDYPREGWPEFAFVGRSNVGKSTLMNTLLGRKGLAKTSSTPGKTQTVNFFDINGKIYFVDLPGYGYAKVPKTMKRQWNVVMGEYLRSREPLQLVAQLFDARHDPTDKDMQMLSMLDEAQVPTLIVVTKIDKLKRSERKRNLADIRKKLALDEDAMLIPFSGVTKEGKREIWRIIDDFLSEPRAL